MELFVLFVVIIIENCFFVDVNVVFWFGFGGRGLWCFKFIIVLYFVNYFLLLRISGGILCFFCEFFWFIFCLSFVFFLVNVFFFFLMVFNFFNFFCVEVGFVIVDLVDFCGKWIWGGFCFLLGWRLFFWIFILLLLMVGKGVILFIFKIFLICLICLMVNFMLDIFG